MLRRAVQMIAALTSVGVLGCGVLLGFLWLDHTRSTILPAPSGSYPVGRTYTVWTDETRLNAYAPTRGITQQLAIWMWYPAAPTPSDTLADYLPTAWRRALAQHQGALLSNLLERDLARVQTHSWNNAKVSSSRAAYPVVILRAGSGALSTDFTTLAEDLASHGYIVVSFDAPYRTVVMVLPDGRIAIRSAQDDVEGMPHAAAVQFATRLMTDWVTDGRFVLDRLEQLNASDPTGRFTGKLDLQHVGIAGQSLGGATAAQFCHDDARCHAGIDIDGMPFGTVIHDGVRRPFFFIMGDHRGESGAEARAVASDIASIYSKLPEGERWEVTIKGANHFSSSDQVLTKSAVVVAVLQRLGVMRLDKRRGLEITATCVRTFFDVYLRGAPAVEMSRLPARYPEIRFGVFGAR